MKNLIPYVRRKQRISQIELARKIGVSPSYLCKIEKSIQEPSLSFIKRCEEILNVNRDELFPERLTKNTITAICTNQAHPLWLERKKIGMKQIDLANRVQCSPSYLSKVERYQLQPTEFFKRQCAKVLKKSELDLFPE